MPGSKIVDHAEVRRWFEQGWTYQQMVDEYVNKYNIETTIAMWGNYRRRNGLESRNVWDVELIPWRVKQEHHALNPVVMLRKLARRRAGAPLTPDTDHQLDAWLAGLEREDLVVHYDPDTVEGFFYVPRRPGVDLSVIREPGRVERRRPDQ